MLVFAVFVPFDHTVYFKNGIEICLKSLKSTFNIFWQRSVCVSKYFIHYHLSFHDMCLFNALQRCSINYLSQEARVTFCKAFLKEFFDIGKDVVSSPLNVDRLGLELFNDWLGVV